MRPRGCDRTQLISILLNVTFHEEKKGENNLPNAMTWSTCDIFYINIIATRPNGNTVITYKRKIHEKVFLLIPLDAATGKRS